MHVMEHEYFASGLTELDCTNHSLGCLTKQFLQCANEEHFIHL